MKMIELPILEGRNHSNILLNPFSIEMVEPLMKGNEELTRVCCKSGTWRLCTLPYSKVKEMLEQFMPWRDEQPKPREPIQRRDRYHAERR